MLEKEMQDNRGPRGRQKDNIRCYLKVCDSALPLSLPHRALLFTIVVPFPFSSFQTISFAIEIVLKAITPLSELGGPGFPSLSDLVLS